MLVHDNCDDIEKKTNNNGDVRDRSNVVHNRDSGVAADDCYVVDVYK